MPLRSKQFAGDARLKACLVKDSAHVLLGDRGPYVRKIQQAVVILGGYGMKMQGSGARSMALWLMAVACR
jgi:hypothetical protein